MKPTKKKLERKSCSNVLPKKPFYLELKSDGFTKSVVKVAEHEEFLPIVQALNGDVLDAIAEKCDLKSALGKYVYRLHYILPGDTTSFDGIRSDFESAVVELRQLSIADRTSPLLFRGKATDCLVLLAEATPVSHRSPRPIQLASGKSKLRASSSRDIDNRVRELQQHRPELGSGSKAKDLLDSNLPAAELPRAVLRTLSEVELISLDVSQQRDTIRQNAEQVLRSMKHVAFDETTGEHLAGMLNRIARELGCEWAISGQSLQGFIRYRSDRNVIELHLPNSDIALNKRWHSLTLVPGPDRAKRRS